MILIHNHKIHDTQNIDNNVFNHHTLRVASNIEIQSFFSDEKIETINIAINQAINVNI